MSTIAAFVRLSRPHFLIGGTIMCVLGAATAGITSPGRLIVAAALVAAGQLTAHYVNEYADYEADLAVVNRTGFSGGSGKLVDGTFTRSLALRCALATTAMTAVLAVLTATFSIPAALCGVAAVAVSWAYSMPPVRLLSTGVGEIVTALTVAGLYPAIGAFSQTDVFPPALWPVIAVLVLLQTAMLLGFELPDLDSDALVGKTVLGVRIGRSRTVTLITVLLAAAALVVVAYSLVGAVPGLVVGALMSGLARNGERDQKVPLAAVAMFFLAGAGLLITSL